MVDNINKISLVGDIRHTHVANDIYQRDIEEAGEFLARLQSLMVEFGVIKVDLCFDPYTFPG